MQKLTNVESQRMMAVMGDLLDRLNYLTYLPLEPQNELLNTLRDHRCLNAAELMREHWRWEHVFTQAQETVDSRLDEIAEQVKLTTRSVCRELRENPVAVETLYHGGTNAHDRSEDMQMLVKALSELTDLTHHQLEKTVEDAKSKKELMHVAEHRMKQAEDERVTIREKLNELRKTKDEEVALLDAHVQKLRNEIHTINQTANNELNMIENELKDAQNKAYDLHTNEMKTLQDKASGLQIQSTKLAQEHQEAEDLLRKKKCKTANELSSLIEKYDTEMVSLEETISELEAEYKKESLECEELYQHFLLIDEEQARIDAEELIVEQLRAQEREKQQFLHNAATKIQKIYRGMVARTEYVKMVAKTKKGKKGGKKGKK